MRYLLTNLIIEKMVLEEIIKEFQKYGDTEEFIQLVSSKIQAAKGAEMMREIFWHAIDTVRYLNSLGKFELAEQFGLQIKSTYDTEDFRLEMHLAESLSNRNLFREANQHLEDAQEYAPRNLREFLQYQQVTNCIKAAESEEQEVRTRMYLDKAIEISNKVLSEIPPSGSPFKIEHRKHTILMKGYALFHRGKVEEAYSTFASLLEIDPHRVFFVDMTFTPIAMSYAAACVEEQIGLGRVSDRLDKNYHNNELLELLQERLQKNNVIYNKDNLPSIFLQF